MGSTAEWRTEERIREFENGKIEIIQSEQQTEKQAKKLTEPQGFVSKTKDLSIYVVKFSEQDKTENGAEKLVKELMAKNFINLARDIHLHTQNTEQTPSRLNPMTFIPRHNIIKRLNTKEKEKI